MFKKKEKIEVEPLKTEEIKGKMTLYRSDSNSTFSVTGHFLEEGIKEVQKHIGTNFVYIGHNCSVNLKFYSAMIFKIDMEDEKNDTN